VEQEAQERRAAENQSLFRNVNEQIEELNETFELYTPYGSWTCECARMGCAEHVQMALAEYEALRQHPARFVVVASDAHVFLEVEQVVERTERYWIVEKVRSAGELAAELDERPRARGDR
jgi:hypothetical protein